MSAVRPWLWGLGCLLMILAAVLFFTGHGYKSMWLADSWAATCLVLGGKPA